MEQLANMPVWAQILSMGSFMFASGVLMTRIPLAPAIILSFFYLYGAFNTTHNMPSFTLHHPWVITALYVGIPLAFLLFVKLLDMQSRNQPGDMQIGGTIWTLIALIPVIIAWLVSFVVAFIKLYKVVASVPIAKYVWAVALCLFIIGFAVGIWDFVHCIFQPGYIVEEMWPYFLGFTVLSVLLCIGSTYGMIYGKLWVLLLTPLLYLGISGIFIPRYL